MSFVERLRRFYTGNAISMATWIVRKSVDENPLCLFSVVVINHHRLKQNAICSQLCWVTLKPRLRLLFGEAPHADHFGILMPDLRCRCQSFSLYLALKPSQSRYSRPALDLAVRNIGCACHKRHNINLEPHTVFPYRNLLLIKASEMFTD